MSGTLALVGGGEFGDDCGFDADLLSIAQASEVLIVPTGAAYEHPERAVAQAASHFESLGAKARGLMVLNRHDALDEANGDEARNARFVYITGGSPMHLRSVMKATPVWEGLRRGVAERRGDRWFVRRGNGTVRPDGRPSRRARSRWDSGCSSRSQ